MPSRFHRSIGQKVVTLNRSATAAAAAAAADAQPISLSPNLGPVQDVTPSSGPGFWESASTTEKVVIVGAAVGTAGILFLALRGGGRRRRRR